MYCVIRAWATEDKNNLAEMLNNKNILNNLRDGLPYPYTVNDAEEFISSMQVCYSFWCGAPKRTCTGGATIDVWTF